MITLNEENYDPNLIYVLKIRMPKLAMSDIFRYYKLSTNYSGNYELVSLFDCRGPYCKPMNSISELLKHIGHYCKLKAFDNINDVCEFILNEKRNYRALDWVSIKKNK